MCRQPTYANFFSTCLSEGNALRKRGEGFENYCDHSEGATALQFSINSKQLIAVVWTLISISISLSVALSLGFSLQPMSWQLSLGLFFALLLVMILPAYLFIALWQMMATD
jgi:ABC-type glycerol-3-phosphate transport system permease component